MKTRTPILSRCLAMFLAVMLAFANVPGLMLTAFAAENVVSEGKVVAHNYELSEAEKALLESGYLAADGIVEYDIPKTEDGWVTVDHENKAIVATEKDGWVAKEAHIVVGGSSVETVVLTDGKGNYTYDENAFSVEVHYELYKTVNSQEELIAAIAHLKQGVANTEAVSGQSGNLFILEKAMPELVKFANEGIQVSVNGNTTTVGFSDAVKDTVNALDAQMTANNGKLNLSVIIEAYNAVSKTVYIVSNGKDMQAEVVDLHAKVAKINVALTTMVDNLALFIQNGWVSEETANQLKTLAGVCENLEDGLATAAADEWYAANNTVVKAEGVDYAELDELVLALGELTAVEIKNPLLVDATTVKVNMDMSDVTVKVVLKVVEDKADSKELVEYDAVSEVLTLSNGTKKADIEAAAQSIIDSALAGWAEVYSAENYVPAYTNLPEKLAQNEEYVITYSPKEYKVSSNYADDMLVPYGYKYTLPKHENGEQAYDYTVNGEKKAQGEVVVILGETTITREAGKAYDGYYLYTIIADNYGNDVAKAILTSGALKDNDQVNVRKPDPTDAASLLKIVNGVLTAEPFAADYNGLSWAAYTYKAGDVEDFFAGNSADVDASSAEVVYKLSLTNYSVEEVAAILELAKTLKEDAAAQKDTLDRMLNYYDVMGDLTGSILAGLSSVIADEYTVLHEDPVKNAELKAYFIAQIEGIKKTNIDSKNNKLKIYNMLGEYKNNGLIYYYQNSSAVIGEISSLSGYLDGLLADDDKIAALEKLMNDNNYGQYSDKLKNLKAVMADVKAALTAPNSKIDLGSSNLGTLVQVLEEDGAVEYTTPGHPYLLSETLTVVGDDKVYVQIILQDKNGTNLATVTTGEMDFGAVLTEEAVKNLKNNVEKAFAEKMKEKAGYYTLKYSESLDELAGKEIEKIVNIICVYSAKEYRVVIEGEKDQIVTIDSLGIVLPVHPNAEFGYEYRYTIGEKTGITGTSYTFKASELDTLFVDGVLVITREEVNIADENIDKAFDKWVIRENGKVVGLRADVDGSKDGVMDFVKKLVFSGYEYIALNGEPLLYRVEDSEGNGSLEVSLQTLINAMMNDKKFSSQTMIDLGNNGYGEFVHAKMDLGYSEKNVPNRNLDFTLYFNSVPSQMGTVAKGLERIKPYMTFKAGDGVMDVEIDLTGRLEKVYEVYLAALLATDNVDKYTMNELNSEVAFQFLWDYIDLIISNPEVTTTTATNTLAKLGIDKDLTGAEEYYQLVKKVLTNEGVKINPEDENDLVDISVTGKSQRAINGLINLLGIDVSAYETYLGMVKEYKDENAVLTAGVRAKLANTDTDYEAALIDVRHPVDSKVDYLDKFDFTENLPARAASIAGEAAIILLADVEGNLVFNDATIIDLNGNNITGDITANGKTLIFDSSLDTYNCGVVDGKLSGNLTIVGGKYTEDVADYIPDGYEVEDGTVRNVLYTINNGAEQASTFARFAKAVNGDQVVFNIDTDILGKVKDIASYTEAATAIAADMAVDLVLNYFTAASLTADGYNIYNIHLDDIIGLYDSTNRKEQLVNQVLTWVDLEDINGFINSFIDKMMDFAAIEKAVRSGDPFIEYDVVTKPWSVAVNHVDPEGEDYLTFGIQPNEDKAKTINVGVMISGDKTAYAANLAGGLSDMVVADETDAEVLINRPSYSDKHLTVSGKGSLVVFIDVTEDQNTENAMTFTNDEYLEVLAVVLGYGLNNEDIVKAIGDNKALKDLIDNLTAAELITALKVMNIPNKFAEMAAAVGYSTTSNAEKLENIYHLIAVALGEALEKLEINGPAKKLGNLYNDATGCYEISGSRAAEKSISRSGYTLTIGAEITELTLKVKLFDDEKPEHVHNWKSEVTKEPTCVEPGIRTYTCECGESYTEEIPATGKHTEGAVVVENEVAADCENAGSYDNVVYCTVCGEELSRDTITVPALGHDEETVPGKAATCTEDGLTDGVICARCGVVLVPQDVIPATGHNHVEVDRKDATCCEKGWVLYQCACGDSYREELDIDPNAHNWVVAEETEPDCENPGTITYKCSNGCGEEFTVTNGEALGHKWSRWEVIRTATYDHDGLMRRYCLVCGEEQFRVIPQLVEPDDKEDEENPSTGAPVVSALAAMAVLAGAGYVVAKSRKH